jgi:hypothetical protein
MAWRPHPESERFLDVLGRVDLPALYYGFIDRHQSEGPSDTEHQEDHERVLRELGLSCDYLPGEPYSTPDQMREAVQLGVELLRGIRTATIEAGPW